MASADCPPYGVQLGTNYPDNYIRKCSEEDFAVMARLLHAIIEADVIISGVDDFAPYMEPTEEYYAPGTIIDHTGQMAQLPDPETVLAHVTPEDEMENLYYEGTTQVVDISEAPSTSPSISPTDSPTTSPSISPSKAPTSSPSTSPSGSPTTDGRRLQEVEVVEEGMWFPFGTFKDGGQPSDFSPETAQRRLPSIDCPTKDEGCNYSGCCIFCPEVCKRRRLEGETVEDAKLRGNRKLFNAAKHAFTGTETQKSYERKVRAMERRVSKALTKKFRFLAMTERIPCLGNFWEIQIDFVTELDLYYAEFFDEDTAARQ
ncbi:expressed unknown protein [Seminavis robusta]|uniref:Uncharacterized protein n=1 Tax=Seminavis robusta TaxID=568900 RepID=A0A9N8E6R8_9STRA|nr:expressed unknown protein [Seminavis robusta]|eukprot:Sro682_g186470.1 n/a (316) ;mRNA; f:17808-18755